MRILVTGGAGYIGSIVAADLLDHGHEVWVLDNLSHGYEAAVPQRAHFVMGSTHDKEPLNHLLAKHRFDTIFHFAAFIEAGESMQNPWLYHHNNLGGSATLIEAAVLNGVHRFVFSSTAAVYIAQDRPLVEDDPKGPENFYGETKWTVERLLAWQGRLSGLRFACLRYFNACGASGKRGEAHQPESHLIPLVLQVAQGKRERIAVFGSDYPTPDGTCIRDYVHVEDLSKAHLLALEAIDRERNVFWNVGTGRGHSVREVIEAARNVTGHPIPAVESPRRSGDAPILVADSSLLRKETGWSPRYTNLEEIIGSAWAWHQAHPQGYDSVG